MRQYGKIKTHTHIAGHQNCLICHPEEEHDRTARARNEGKKEIEEQVLEVKENAE